MSLAFSSIAIAGAVIVTDVAGVLTIVNAGFAAIASLGAVFIALSSYGTLREQIYQSQRIAERYALMSDALQNSYMRLDAVRKAVLTDGQEPLLRYIEAIHQVLMAEHKQWPGEQEQRSPVLDKLDSLLKQATAQSSGKEKKRPRKKAFEICSLEPESKNTETLQAAPTMTFLHY